MPLTDHNFTEKNPVDLIFYGRTPIKKAASFLFFSKKGAVKQLLHHLKYKNQENIGQFLGDWCGAVLEHDQHLASVDAVVPVPLHAKKQKKRGYNQVALFAKQIAKTIHAEYRDDILVKVAHTKTQTKKSRLLRWESAQAVFEVNPKSKNSARHILLVDDVITTGATIEACAQKLHSLGNVSVSVLSMAVVPKG